MERSPWIEPESVLSKRIATPLSLLRWRASRSLMLIVLSPTRYTILLCINLIRRALEIFRTKISFKITRVFRCEVRITQPHRVLDYIERNLFVEFTRHVLRTPFAL